MTHDELRQIAMDEAERLGMPFQRAVVSSLDHYWVIYLIWRWDPEFGISVLVNKVEANAWHLGEKDFAKLRVEFELKENAEFIRKEWMEQALGEKR